MPPLPHSNGDTSRRPSRRTTTGPPTWVKIFGILSLVLVALFVVLHLTGGGFGDHGLHSGGH